MAILDQNKNNFVVDRDENQSLGFRLPLVLDNGFDATTNTTLEAVKQNLLSLCSTERGERIMQPNLGLRLRQYLFEPKQHVASKIRQRVEGQVAKYMPFIRINKLQFNHGLDPKLANDSNILSVLIEYEVPSLNLSTNIIIQSEDIN